MVQADTLPSPLVGEGVAHERSECCDGRGVLAMNNPPSVWLRCADAQLASQLPPQGGKRNANCQAPVQMAHLAPRTSERYSPQPAGSMVTVSATSALPSK